jgi:hypothetical protein
VATVPHGWKVRTVQAGEHRVRVAFPPGRREKGSGIPVEVLHPRNENPCTVNNPAELVLMGANPMAGVYDALSTNEKLAFGRLGLGKRQIQTKADLAKARRMVNEATRLRNRLPNPGPASLSEDAEGARELAAEFKDHPSETYSVFDEPHIAAGDYARLGKFFGIAVKPEIGGVVQEISFASYEVLVIADPSGHPIHIIGPQELEESEIALFSTSTADPCLLGEGRGISYQAAKWHPEVSAGLRGKVKIYEHHFGAEGGRKPEVWYSRRMSRLVLRGGDYFVERRGIRN